MHQPVFLFPPPMTNKNSDESRPPLQLQAPLSPPLVRCASFLTPRGVNVRRPPAHVVLLKAAMPSQIADSTFAPGFRRDLETSFLSRKRPPDTVG